MMTGLKIHEAFDMCHQILDLGDKLIKAKEHLDVIGMSKQEFKEHTKSMFIRLEEFKTFDGFIPEERERVMRWLGWIQGGMVTLGFCSINEMRSLNRPD
ncbi:MAG: hypothetical protein OEX08_01430 [Candidatus Nomurabacteria bacterium]|nr:hypothetical protein [Candidatus Nomurabacteria bacterium]